MSDVEKLTNDNQERRRWAEQVDAREALARAEKATMAVNNLKKRREREVRSKAARACYMAAGACAGIAGAFIAAGVLSHATRSWIGAIGAIGICAIFILCAAELDEGV